VQNTITKQHSTSINNNQGGTTMTRKVLAVLVMAALATTMALAQSVVASKHDLSTLGGIADRSTNETQVCIFCHTPHQKGMTAKPLWNKTLSAQATYGTYTNTTIDATDITDIGGGTGVSNLCMSCHDGTVAVNSLGNTSGVGTPTMGSGTELDATGHIRSAREAYLGTDLTNDHPINFTYDATLATNDGGLATPNSARWVDAAHTIPLYGAKVQCASCHNPHDNQYGSFARVTNARSALCIKCHNK
jgi:predicted CXXCH cytochrome family protein